MPKGVCHVFYDKVSHIMTQRPLYGRCGSFSAGLNATPKKTKSPPLKWRGFTFNFTNAIPRP